MIIVKTNCENNKIEVFDKDTSILYDYIVVKADKENIYLNNTYTNPLVNDFLNSNLNTKIELANIKGWVNIDIYYFKAYTSNFTVVNNNELHFCGIYTSFIGYDYVLIDKEVYHIDKSKSNDCLLFLKTPLKKPLESKNLGKGIKQSKIGYNICQEISKIVKTIVSLKCEDCSKEYQKYYKDLIKLQLLNSSCITDEDIKSIVDSITYVSKQC